MTKPQARVRVAVIFGGVSSEHDVSCLTAGGVTRAMDPDRYEVIGIGITPAGKWTQVDSAAMAAMEVVDGRLPRLGEDAPEAVLLQTPGEGGRIATLGGDRLTDVRDFDVAFALLHGPFGEDGTIQGLFEMYGVRYVGTGVAGSAIGMDKDLMKRTLQTGGLPVGPWLAVTPIDWATDRDGVLEAARDLELPLFVKPARGGSSMGISRVADYADLPAAMAQRFDPKVVIEQGFTGVREIECAVLSDPAGGAPRVSVPGEIEMHTAEKFYDYQAKYLAESQVSLHVPADLDDDLREQCRAVAGAAFGALAAEGLARVDLFTTAQGEVYVNEINTMPGFTRFSMYPMMWDASGLSYPEVIDWLVDLALTRPMGLR